MAQGRFASLLGRDYPKAEKFLQENDSQFRKLASFGIVPEEAMAIVFPELIRYSDISNSLEVLALQVMYVQFGTQYSDFSVGPLQMKPSFAERLESEPGLTSHWVGQGVGPDQDRDKFNSSSGRERRLERLTRLDGQLTYLTVFFKWMDQRYRSQTWASREEKIRFYATAYNSGYWLAEDRIRKLMRQSYFKTSSMSNTAYNYGDIAIDYYRRLIYQRQQNDKKSFGSIK
ncbi:hypothetical protein KJS94_18125 [Flavihumibacter rivuli]|uniref:hypothetical protein n=1 Tax=Flavihumibacter rivuli TaxID=2838156 RepID=UPI001BDE89EB|nr:hypothetical protein [Flavihumibacter rivuli]ULQ56573.1 hypothetical protein KJS94_18125 [Flavihumibacter rivuli]